MPVLDYFRSLPERKESALKKYTVIINSNLTSSFLYEFVDSLRKKVLAVDDDGGFKNTNT